MKRISDKETFAKLQVSLASSCRPSSVTWAVSCILKNSDTVNNIVLSVQSTPSATPIADKVLQVVLNDLGVASECLALQETWNHKWKDEESKKLEAAQKSQQKLLE